LAKNIVLITNQRKGNGDVFIW